MNFIYRVIFNLKQMKKLAAIYNVFDGEELLEKSMACMEGQVDLFIIVWQDVSNWGEPYNPMENLNFKGRSDVVLVKYNPPAIAFDWSRAAKTEKEKRNLGIQIAQEHNCTHFLHLDCDEFYADFMAAKQQYIDSGCDGSVCRMYTYFKRPTWRLKNYDNYYVPFIHKLKRNTQAGAKKYPFYCDPTRAINTNDVVIIDEPMHHMSWVRRNIERKANNSTAKHNIEKSNLLRDYRDPNTGPGTRLVDYHNQELIKVKDLFGLSALFSH